MIMFGHPVENVEVVDSKDDGDGDMLYRIRFQYVERAVPDAVWYTWQYADDIPGIV